MPPEELLRSKLDLEARLSQQSGHVFVCAANAGECLVAYAELSSLDWDKSRLAKGLPIVVAAGVPSSVGKDGVVLSLHYRPSELESLLGVAPLPEAASEVVNHLGASGPENQPRVCDDGQAFYDRLFAKDEVLVTIVVGFMDEHLESIRGYIRCVLLKLDRIPVFLRNQEQLAAQFQSELVGNGFVEEASSSNELRLSRKFYYRQRLKTLRAHVVFSVAACPGETRDSSGRLWRHDNQTCPDQQRATAHAKARFVDGLATSEIVMYHGHSRGGRGLDFGPMSLGDGRLRLDCDSLACARGNTPQALLFVNSCDSVGYYGGAVAKVRGGLSAGRKLAWLGVVGDVRFMNAPQTSMRLINMLIEARCPGELLAVLNLPRFLADTSRVEGEDF